ncbi:MAG: hypothetical protein IPJ02_11530 [Chitinophagaceae bacterium]|nr:hypothetical protein [Chitinophagaceae bacterium]
MQFPAVIRTTLFLGLTVTLLPFSTAQSLTGIWSGKISRKGPGRQGVESIEMQVYQSGKRLSGYSFTFKDTSRFVLYDMNGTRDKKHRPSVSGKRGMLISYYPPAFFPAKKNSACAITRSVIRSTCRVYGADGDMIPPAFPVRNYW